MPLEFRAARLFARRRAIYRRKANIYFERAATQEDEDLAHIYWERFHEFTMAAEAIEYMWHDLRALKSHDATVAGEG